MASWQIAVCSAYSSPLYAHSAISNWLRFLEWRELSEIPTSFLWKRKGSRDIWTWALRVLRVLVWDSVAFGSKMSSSLSWSRMQWSHLSKTVACRVCAVTAECTPKSVSLGHRRWQVVRCFHQKPKCSPINPFIFSIDSHDKSSSPKNLDCQWDILD